MFRVVEWTQTRRRLCFESSGRLEPFLGHALRGIAGHELKRAECRIVPAPLYCRDAGPDQSRCPYHGECAYGDLLEPALPPGRNAEPGKEDLLRPITIGAEFPAPARSESGLELEVSSLFLGQGARRWAPRYWRALAEAGSDPSKGLGPDRVRFTVAPPRDGMSEREGTIDLPLSEAEDPGEADGVEIELTTPLHLREAGRPIESPTCGQLIRAGLRTIGAAGRLYGWPLPDEVFARVKAAAERVSGDEHHLRSFAHRRASNRTRQAVDFPGRLGVLSYRNVPRWLIPWLDASGFLRVGLHRVAGAGGFRARTRD